MTAQPTNESLLARVAERDEAALVELHARLAPMLLGLVSRIALDTGHAAAAVEETFVRLWREAPRFAREEASVTAWLVVMTRRVAVDQRRQRDGGIPQRKDPLAVLAGSYAWLPRPEEMARLEARRELLTKVINQLPKPQRAALEFAVFEGLGEEEIAQRLGEPLGRVRSALRAGMRFIRHRMRAVLGTWSANI
jgi:RNA polymerase sigma-70 factor (ECF subfamily)